MLACLLTHLLTYVPTYIPTHSLAHLRAYLQVARAARPVLECYGGGGGAPPGRQRWRPMGQWAAVGAPSARPGHATDGPRRTAKRTSNASVPHVAHGMGRPCAGLRRGWRGRARAACPTLWPWQSVRLEYEGSAWIGLGISSDCSMTSAGGTAARAQAYLLTHSLLSAPSYSLAGGHPSYSGQAARLRSLPRGATTARAASTVTRSSRGARATGP